MRVGEETEEDASMDEANTSLEKGSLGGTRDISREQTISTPTPFLRK